MLLQYVVNFSIRIYPPPHCLNLVRGPGLEAIHLDYRQVHLGSVLIKGLSSRVSCSGLSFLALSLLLILSSLINNHLYPSLQSMQELDEISRMQGEEWGVHGVHI